VIFFHLAHIVIETIQSKVKDKNVVQGCHTAGFVSQSADIDSSTTHQSNVPSIPLSQWGE
jgi:hypothetical protein